MREKLRLGGANAEPKKLKETVSWQSASSAIAKSKQPEFFGAVIGHPHRSRRFSCGRRA
jgi:hypothetical protein